MAAAVAPPQVPAWAVAPSASPSSPSFLAGTTPQRLWGSARSDSVSTDRVITSRASSRVGMTWCMYGWTQALRARGSVSGGRGKRRRRWERGQDLVL